MSRGDGESPALDFYGLLRELREHDVEFVLIGGFALGFHGVPRGRLPSRGDAGPFHTGGAP